MRYVRGVPVTLDAGHGKAGKRAPVDADGKLIQASQDAITATFTVDAGQYLDLLSKTAYEILALQQKINGLTSEMVARHDSAYYVKLN